MPPILLPTMTLRPYRISALLVLGTALLAVGAVAQNHPSTTNPAPASPYGGVTVEDIVARVNDQIITRSDYDRAMKEIDQDGRQRGLSMQQISDQHKDLLRNLIDQQLWLSKGKELGVTGETDLVKQLDEIRKKYNLETMEDLEKAAKEQGVSFEDFKANIRNQIITQQVMRDQVGRKVSVTPGEVQRYFEAHKQDYTQPESVHLSEILISTGKPAPSATDPGGVQPEDPQKLATAKAKADDVEAKLKDGGNFDQLARSNSDGPTAAQGGDLGKFGRNSLAKVLEDKTFALQAGQYTEPIRTKQGYVILKVDEHVTGGVPQFKDVEQQVEENFYQSRMEPAIRAYLTTMREEAYIDIKPGYVDTAASPRETKPIYSAYTPPSIKKKKKVQRTRFRETEHGFRKKGTATATALPATADTSANAAKGKKVNASANASMKPGKKEKIRYGQAPRETLPNAAATKTEDAGALPKTDESAAAQDVDNPLDKPVAPVKKTRYSARMKLAKEPKAKGPQLDSFTPAPPDAGEVADRQMQTAPLGLSGDTSKKHKKKKPVAETNGKKTRMQDQPKKPSDTKPLEMTPAPTVPGAPAPKPATPPTPPVNQNPSVDQTAPDQTPAPTTEPVPQQ
ncbi:peptidylprolyl isomerase [Acidicapsa ligni]|uniref:peptidylprolyl isomerase n=1 Tax=Acidicapsa ligni TaxID=542300 RepID=UPI0021E00764|nr:peptidylprolyl isomerase [Acidicapsa ligni]